MIDLCTTRRSLALLTLVLPLATLPACNAAKSTGAKQERPPRWDEMRGRVKQRLAEQHFEAGLFDEAVQAATEALALAPTEPDTFVLLARAQLELGKPASAQRTLETAAERGLRSAELHYIQGVILEQWDDLDAALQEYTQARASDAHNVAYLLAQAECLVALDRAPEALALLDGQVDQYDEDGTVALLAGHVALLLDDTDEAAKRYRQVFATLSESRILREQLGLLLADKHRPTEVITLLEPLMEPSFNAKDGQGAARRALAGSYLAVGDADSARNVLGDYVRANPNDARAQLLLAKAALATNDTLSALSAVNMAKQGKPYHPEVWFVKAVVDWRRGNYAAAASALHDILENDPRDVDAHCLLAEVLRAQAHYESARTYFQRALEIDPECAWATAGLNALAKAIRLTPAEPASRLTAAPATPSPQICVP